MESNLKEIVREKYGQAAVRAKTGGASACCGTSPSAAGGCDPITSNLYAEDDAGGVPELALKASLGCGNPTALAELKAGETVLDLGSGGGIDVLLSARRVGPTGKAFGLDMTDEMLAVADENRRKSGLTNVEFLKGEIEHIPLPDDSVDVIISNCVINLSGDKDQVIREAFRVLKPGGRFAVSDVVVRGAVPAEIRKSMELWIGCVAGALSEDEYPRQADPRRVPAGEHRGDAGLRRRGRASFPRQRGRRCRRAVAEVGRHLHQRLRPGDQARWGLLRADLLLVARLHG